MERQTNKLQDSIKKSTKVSNKNLICIICQEKLPINDDKHICSYRTNKSICINFKKCNS
jgi:hypothetical protein